MGTNRQHIGAVRRTFGRRSAVPAHVDVWLVDLDEPPITPPLSPEELTRSRTFANAEARARFVASRSALREIIGARSGTRPRDVVFRLTATGKPTLGAGAPSFSLSHCDNTALIAVSDDTPVGVDIERLQHGVDVRRIAHRFFAPSEAQRIDAAHDEARAFFTAWTRTEAVAKASGDGFRSFRSIRFNESATVARVGVRTWSTAAIAIELPFIGSLASRGEAEIQLKRWPSE